MEEDIFDPEIIYCVTKLTIEPFIDIIYDNFNYDLGNDYIISYIKTDDKTINKYLCISFEEELNIKSLSKNIYVKKNFNKKMGTVLVIDYNGGDIILNNPLNNISFMYYSYIASLSNIQSIEWIKIPLIKEKDEFKGNTIFLSNIDTLVIKDDILHPKLIMKKIPKGSCKCSMELYPKRIMSKGWKIPPPPEIMTDSLPCILEINEEDTQTETKNINLENDEKRNNFCCVKYCVIPLYNFLKGIVEKSKEKETKDTITLSNKGFADSELP